MSKDFIRYQPRLREFSSQLRRNMTRGEVLLWERLRRRQLAGIRFLRQRPIYSFIVDFLAPDLRLVIEVDGSSHDGAPSWRRDSLRDAQLKKLGFSVIRVTEEEVCKDPDAVAEWIGREAAGIKRKR